MLNTKMQASIIFINIFISLISCGQCDRDSATAKRQMNYYVDGGKNIESALQMNEALRTATALCGFNSMVMEIKEKKVYSKQSNIRDVSKVHCIKYVQEGDELKYHAWQYYGIGEGKRFDVGDVPISLKVDVIVSFEKHHVSVGKAGRESKKHEIIYCSEPMCIKSFSSVDKMLHHLDFGKHEFQPTKSSSMDKVKDNWVKRFCVDDVDSKFVCFEESNLIEVIDATLTRDGMGGYKENG